MSWIAWVASQLHVLYSKPDGYLGSELSGGGWQPWWGRNDWSGASRSRWIGERMILFPRPKTTTASWSRKYSCQYDTVSTVPPRARIDWIKEPDLWQDQSILSDAKHGSVANHVKRMDWMHEVLLIQLRTRSIRQVWLAPVRTPLPQPAAEAWLNDTYRSISKNTAGWQAAKTWYHRRIIGPLTPPISDQSASDRPRPTHCRLCASQYGVCSGREGSELKDNHYRLPSS
jgi:hypothetical protein